MPKSVAFNTLETLITNIQKAKSAFIESGKKESLAINLNVMIKKFTACLNENEHVLTERNEAGNIPMLVVAAFSAVKYADILNMIFEDILIRIKRLSTEQQLIIYTAKGKNGQNLLKLAATQSLSVSGIILREICALEDLSRTPQILTGIDNPEDKTATPYTRVALANLRSQMQLLTREQRGNLIAARDADDCNAIAYAASIQDSDFIKLALHFAPDVAEADPAFLSDPTESSQANANIFFYILSQLNLVMQLPQLRDRSTLKKMLTTRGVGGVNAIASALETPKLLAALLTLVQHLEVGDQKVILNQLTRDAKQKLAAIAECPEEIKAMLEVSLAQKPSSPEFFKAADGEAIAATAVSADNTLPEADPDLGSDGLGAENSSTLR